MDAETRERLIDQFLQGSCASYAVAVWRHLGRPEDGGIEVIFDDDGEPNTDDGRCAVHAFWSGDLQADARGVRTPEDMADEYGLASHSVDGPYHPEAFLDMFCGHDGAFEFDEDDVEEALSLIRHDPTLVEKPA
jgi:hypothetical protein